MFVSLAEDPELVEKYKKNPKGVLLKAGISTPLVDALASGDIAKIYNIFKKHAKDGQYPGKIIVAMPILLIASI